METLIEEGSELESARTKTSSDNVENTATKSIKEERDADDVG